MRTVLLPALFAVTSLAFAQSDGGADDFDTGGESEPGTRPVSPTSDTRPVAAPAAVERAPAPTTAAGTLRAQASELIAFLESTQDTAPPSGKSSALNVADAIFVDGARGRDGDAGSAAEPFRTLARALRAVRAGQQIVLRGGVYREGGLDIDARGRASAPVVIRGFPGERVIIDGGIGRYQDSPGGGWELVDPATNTYRSVSTDHGDRIHVGRAIDGKGEVVRLVPYNNDPERGARGLRDLQSTVETVGRRARYVGPGVYNDAGRLYLRLAPLARPSVHGARLPALARLDPNELDIRLSSRYWIFRVRGSHLRFEDLELRGAVHGALLEPGVSDVRFERVRFVVGTIGIRGQDVRDVRVSDCDFLGDFPPHVAWSDMKGQNGQSRPASHWSLRSSGLHLDGSSDVVVENSRFQNIFDGLLVTRSNRITVQENVGRFIDDMIQLGSDSSHVTIRSNRIAGAGPSHHGRGNPEVVGSVYVYRNVIDATPPILWGKADPRGILREAHSGWHSTRPFPAHEAGELGRGAPWKIYHNTIIFDGAKSTAGFDLRAGRNRTGVPHEVYNNIFVNTGDGPFAADLSVRSDAHYDGNVYWRTSGSSDRLFARVSNGSTTASFETLDEFRASRLFELSQQQYAAGWEANGRDADPALDERYRPGADGAATARPVPLPRDFPGGTPRYRGARAPR